MLGMRFEPGIHFLSFTHVGMSQLLMIFYTSMNIDDADDPKIYA
jgi:hypothetical protein